MLLQAEGNATDMVGDEPLKVAFAKGKKAWREEESSMLFDDCGSQRLSVTDCTQRNKWIGWVVR